MICENDCIHYDVCLTYNGGMTRTMSMTNKAEERCGYFKNKADYAEVKHGHWIKHGNEKKCSVCAFFYYSNNDEWNGCPNCLAKMDVSILEITTGRSDT